MSRTPTYAEITKERLKVAHRMKREPETKLEQVPPSMLDSKKMPPGCTRVFTNNRYICMVHDHMKTTSGEAIAVLVQTPDDMPIQNHWSEMQKIKNAISGLQALGIEYNPAESKLINSHNLSWPRD